MHGHTGITSMSYDEVAPMYYDDYNSTIRMDVTDKPLLKKLTVGQKARFDISGEVVEIEAPRMVEDYDAPYTDADRKAKKKRPQKEMPGKVCLKLDKKSPDIELLDINAMLMDEEM